MKLPFLGNFGKKEVKNYFLALLLQDEKIGAVILEEIAGRIHVVASSEEHFSTSLEKASFEEWLNIIDKAVSLAESNVMEDIQTEKTVLGVKQDWVEDGKIKKEYLVKLKKVCDELALQPIGFLVFTEAIIHLLQEEEGAPVSAILVEVGKKYLTISIIRAGRIVQTQLVPMEEKITDDVDNALKHFETEILPARIILYSGSQNEKLSQSFINHVWSKSLPFLHMPQITVLPANFETKGVLYGTAAQMGFEVFGEEAIPSKIISSSKETVATKEEKTESEKVEEEKEEPKEETETLKEEETEYSPETTLQEILETEEKDEEEEKPKEHLETVDSDYFGFVENKDVSTVSHKELPKFKKGTEEVIEEIPEEVMLEETDYSKPTGEIGTQGALLLQGAKKGIGKIIKNLPKTAVGIKVMFNSLLMGFKKGRSPRDGGFEKPQIELNKIIIIPAVLAAIIIIVLIYVFTISAQVTIALTPKTIEEKTPVVFAVDGQSNFDKNQVAATTISQNESGTLSQQTTGTKEVGTPAKGQITIYSTLTSQTTISKGTSVVSDNNLKYTLDSDVTVASSSGDPSDPNLVKTATVNVTSSDIGPAYNLPSGAKFSISGYSKTDVSAKNDNPFSGGTKKDISVVSKDDVDKLLSTLTKSLETNAGDDIKKTLDPNKQLLPFFAKEDVVKQTLSKNIGDEANDVSVDATIAYEALAVDKNDLTTFAKQILSGKLTPGEDLASSKLETNLTDTKQDKDTISGNLSIKAFLLPKIDQNQITKDISGKSFSQAESVIKNIPQVSDVQMHLSPNIPLLPKILPRIGSHIHIKILTDE